MDESTTTRHSCVVRIARYLIDHEGLSGDTLNVANTRNYQIKDIVSTLEQVCGKKAVYDVVEKGASYAVDVQRIEPILTEARVEFHSSYLRDVLQKYYG